MGEQPSNRGIFRWSDKLNSLEIQYQAESRSFRVDYGTKREKPQAVVITLVVKEFLPEGNSIYRPILITPPTIRTKFQLPLTMFSFCPEFRLCSLQSPVRSDSNQVLKALLTVHFTEKTGITEFPFVTVGDPVDVVELVGMGPKMKTVCLYRRALDHIETCPSKYRMNEAFFLYRNQTKEYFDDIFKQQFGIMRPSRKDNHGDPYNPINGKLFGLFFRANVHNQRKTPLLPSPFGQHRLLIHVGYLVRNMAGNCNLYFADFCCIDKHHSAPYTVVTLVFTQNGSFADQFCRENLLPLPPNNPFFRLYNGIKFEVSGLIWVEIFYTQEIDLVRMNQVRDASFMMQVPSRRMSRPECTPKDPSCTVCNARDYEEWEIV